MLFWQVWHSLPWNRFEDFALGVALSYHRKGSVLFSCVWAAKEAHKLYLNLQAKAIDCHKVPAFFSCHIVPLFNK
jgi:hypothetical protein